MTSLNTKMADPASIRSLATDLTAVDRPHLAPAAAARLSPALDIGDDLDALAPCACGTCASTGGCSLPTTVTVRAAKQGSVVALLLRCPTCIAEGHVLDGAARAARPAQTVTRTLGPAARSQAEREWDLAAAEETRQMQNDAAIEAWNTGGCPPEYLLAHIELLDAARRGFAADLLAYPSLPLNVWIHSADKGTGKTDLAAALGRALAERGHRSRWVNASDVARLVAAGADDDARERLHRLTTCKVLIADDFGKQPRMSLACAAAWYRITETRTAAGRTTIWTSNLPLPEDSEDLGALARASQPQESADVLENLEAAVDRIGMDCEAVDLPGTSYRLDAQALAAERARRRVWWGHHDPAALAVMLRRHARLAQ